MLALHGAQTVGGAQFYIGCAQLKVTGTGSATCGPTISIPGAYNAEDDNIYIPNVYNGFDASTYKAPGGPVASCGAGSGSAAPTAPSAPANSTVPAVPSVVASPTVVASASASAVVEATPTPVASAPAASSPVASSAPSSAPAPATSSGAGNDGALPATFTLETFIAWLQGKVGAASKARRHARAF
jgi:cellulase